MSPSRARALTDLGSLLAGIVWGAVAVDVLHMPIGWFLLATAAAAFIIGWVRWGITQRFGGHDDS